MRMSDEVKKTEKVGAASSGRFRPDGLPAGGTASKSASPRDIQRQQQRQPEPDGGAMAAAFAKLKR
jgi:hypothetical protein